jgi:alpha-galactosidase
MFHSRFLRFSATVIGSLALAFSVSAQTSTISGNWVWQGAKLHDGTYDKFYFQFEQKGQAITGRVIYPWGILAITEGSIEGNHFRFVQAPVGEYKFVGEGDVVGDELHFRVTYFDNKYHDRIVRRCPPDEGNPPARIELPALHDVPWNGLAKTPPMGWNSWNKFGGNVSDEVVRGIADAMVSSGMRDAGYIYVNIDDTWEGRRDSTGALQPNHKFPDMKALADYVHSRGLKLGIYSSPGPKTCGGYEGSYGHEEQDARTFAAWGVDLLKYDWCSAGKLYDMSEVRGVYQKMGDLLLSSGRPILYSLCEYGAEKVWEWGPKVGGNMWRTVGDINDTWEVMAKNGFSQSELAAFAAPGHWNDPDMLEVGNGGMTDEEYRTHMSLWSILAAPLLAGNDLRTMSQSTRDILVNREVIAIDQDPAGKQGTRLSKSGERETWTKPLAGGAVAVGLFNRGAAPAMMALRLPELKLSGKVQARDLWAHKDVKFKNGVFEATVPGHGVVLLRIEPSGAGRQVRLL